MNMSETIGQLAKALSLAQAELKHAKKKESNPFYKSKYADLAEVLDVCREPLSKNGLAITQIPMVDDNGCLVLRTMIIHETGEWIAGNYPLKPQKDDPQGYGSAITYARRYALAAYVQIAQEDDDGNAASTAPKVNIKKEVKDQVYKDTVDALATDDRVKLLETWEGFSQEEMVELWKLFNSQQRAAIKKMQKGE